MFPVVIRYKKFCPPGWRVAKVSVLLLTGRTPVYVPWRECTSCVHFRGWGCFGVVDCRCDTLVFRFVLSSLILRALAIPNIRFGVASKLVCHVNYSGLCALSCCTKFM